jgi:polar amino acid transport system substrate-binding protein
MVFGRSIPLSMFLIMLTAACAHAACEPAKVGQKYPTYAGKVVKIAASPTQPPFAFTDPVNPERMSGLEAEMIEKAMSCAGLKFEYVKGAWSALLPALYSGAADVMIGAVNYRPERAERADFILYMRAGQGIVVQRGNPKKIGDMDSLCGHIGSSAAGGSPALAIESQSKVCVEQGKPAIEFLPAVDVDASYRQVVNGRVDFAMDDAPAAALRVKNEPTLEMAHTVVTQILSGFVVPKGNKEMLAIVADGLKAAEQDGTIVQLAKKYGLPAEMVIPIETRP